MILNELVKGCSYNVEELPVKTDAAHFRSIVNFDGQEFAGTGKLRLIFAFPTWSQQSKKLLYFA